MCHHRLRETCQVDILAPLAQCYHIVRPTPLKPLSSLQRLSEYPGLPDMKQIGPQTQRAAAVEAGKRTGSTDIVLDSRQPEKPCSLWKKNKEAETRVNLGVKRRRQLRAR